MSESNLKIDSVQNPRVTWEGCSVLLDINDGDRLVFARLSPGSTVKIGDKKCSLQPLIGCRFGSVFQVESGSKGAYLSRVIANKEGAHLLEKADCELHDEPKDNRALVDDNKAQTLSAEEINAMRSQGATGDQIVEALIANSSTFEKKTSFSQEKYRLKKQKKYAPRVLLRRPFARSICEAYFKKYPARIGFLRVDTLSLLLSMANVSAYSDVLVVDMVGGILTGAVAERLGGSGYICNMYFGASPYPMEIVKIFNFNNDICSRIVRSASSNFHLAENNDSVQVTPQEGAFSSEIRLDPGEAVLSTGCVSSNSSLPLSGDQFVQEQISPSDLNPQSMSGTAPSENGMPNPVPMLINEINASPVIKACKFLKPGEKASQEAISLWKQNGFTSLVIAAPENDTWNMVRELLPLLSYSAPFAVYHQYLQPLATCMHNLQVAKMAVSLQISEPWLREYQVLPSRTHPCMQMSGSGGYILSGIRLCTSTTEQQAK